VRYFGVVDVAEFDGCVVRHGKGVLYECIIA
jgi:hypothetical protein